MRCIKDISIFILLWVVTVNANSQDSSINFAESEPYQAWINQIPENKSQAAQYYFEDLDEFIQVLRAKQTRYKDQSKFLRYVYYKTHRKYLRRYQSPSTLSELVEKGYYDCITGSALYGMIFDQLGVSHTIVETTFHVYLTLDINNQVILVEPTNPLGGFIEDSEIIKTTLKSYREDEAGKTWKNQDYYQPYHQANNGIDLVNLAGLQYFNQAVEAYNQRNLRAALYNLAIALDYYPSARLKEMMALMLKTLEQEKQFDPLLKQQYLSKYGHLRFTNITAQVEK